MFVDTLHLFLKAGKGGDGIVAWRREKYIPKGGPAGGDGGNGGSIIIKTTPHELSLELHRHKKQFVAQNGQGGGSNNCKGKDGEDIIIEVPSGTLIKDAKTNQILFDLTDIHQEIEICKGGKGGKGNTHFKSPTNRAPEQHTLGTPGQEFDVIFELKLIADIGLVGMPNAGKSTLLSNLAKVTIKIGAYPFTTLFPNLAAIEFDHHKRFIADIPGIIEGAHHNKGLGLEFLKHIERTKVLVYVLNAAEEEGYDPIENFNMLKQEINKYNPSILEKPFLIALNKMDLPSAEEKAKSFTQHFEEIKDKILKISALNKEGLTEIKKAISEQLFAAEYAVNNINEN